MRTRWSVLAVVTGTFAVSLIGASAAWGSYTVTAQCTVSDQTSPCGTGWYTNAVSVNWTWSPQDGGNPASGCVPHSYVQDTSETISCTIIGPSGQTATSEPIHVELSSPTATASPARAPDFNGWYNHAVSATVTGSAFSGIASCTPTSYSGPNSTTATVSGTCVDNAGKSVTAMSSQFNYEATGPNVTAAPARGPDSNGWFNHAVAATVSGTSFSGITSCSGTTYSGPDSKTATVSGTCVDNAGNSTVATSAPFQYEASSPTITVTPSRGADSNGWYDHVVAATVTGMSFSGITSCSGTTYSGPDSRTATLSGTCTDNAGKTTVAASAPFEYEASSPTITVTLARGPDSNGWYNHAVAATVTGTSFSGIASCSGTTYSGPDSTTATVSGTCTDNAGKSATLGSSDFEYEATSPSVTATPARHPDSNGWYNHAVAATVSGTSFSGIASCSGTTYSGPDSTTATVSGSCTDNAGKSATATSGQFSYEASAPTVSVVPGRPPDLNRWYNSAVPGVASGTSFSGIASCTATTYSGPDSTSGTVSGTCTDNAGKSTTATSQPFQYDGTTPTISVAPDRPPDSGGWYNHAVAATVSGTSFSGIASCSGTTYSGPDSTTATVSGTCTDNAGNTAVVASAPFLYEASAPTVTAVPARDPDSNGWYNHAVAATVTGTSFSGIASCSPTTYSGPDSTTATVSGSCTDNAGKSATATSGPFSYEASAPTVSVALDRPPDLNGWYNSPVSGVASGSSFSGIASCTATTYSGPDSTSGTVSGTCTDNAGKSTTATSQPFQYDGTTPTISVAPDRPPDANGWYNHAVTARVDGGSVSGLASCTETTYSGPDSTHATVSATCTDNAGNTTVVASAPFQYEASSPTVSVAPDRPPDSNGWYNHAVTGNVVGSSFSGITSCSASTYSGPDGADATLTGSCTDKAGKTTTATSDPFLYSGSSPTLAVVADSADHVVTLRWVLAGPSSLASVRIVRAPGLRRDPATVVYQGSGTAYQDDHVRNGSRYRYTFQATDRAGNTTTTSVVVLPGPRLLAPAQNAVLTGPPLLSWTPVRHADYYNLQLFRGQTKILSAWPVRPTFRLKRGWRFEGRRYELLSGAYRWYVWPGYGARTSAKYGPTIGHLSFVVSKGHP